MPVRAHHLVTPLIILTLVVACVAPPSSARADDAEDDAVIDALAIVGVIIGGGLLVAAPITLGLGIHAENEANEALEGTPTLPDVRDAEARFDDAEGHYQFSIISLSVGAILFFGCLALLLWSDGEDVDNHAGFDLVVSPDHVGLTHTLRF